MKFTQDFDQYLRMKKGTAEYLADKSKAGRIGGYVGRNSPEHSHRAMEALGLSNIHRPKDMYVLCLKPIAGFKAGEKYHVTMGDGAKMLAPTTHQFKNWYEFLLYFKRFKNKV